MVPSQVPTVVNFFRVQVSATSGKLLRFFPKRKERQTLAGERNQIRRIPSELISAFWASFWPQSTFRTLWHPRPDLSKLLAVWNACRNPDSAKKWKALSLLPPSGGINLGFTREVFPRSGLVRRELPEHSGNGECLARADFSGCITKCGTFRWWNNSKLFGNDYKLWPYLRREHSSYRKTNSSESARKSFAAPPSMKF